MIENMVNSDDLLCQEILKVVRNINSARSETGVKDPNSSLSFQFVNGLCIYPEFIKIVVHSYAAV